MMCFYNFISKSSMVDSNDTTILVCITNKIADRGISESSSSNYRFFLVKFLIEIATPDSPLPTSIKVNNYLQKGL